jgi:hypothetical protein
MSSYYSPDRSMSRTFVSTWHLTLDASLSWGWGAILTKVPVPEAVQWCRAYIPIPASDGT